MKSTNDRSMWEFQQRFRWGVERGIESALSAIGLPVEVRAILVGFATSDGHGGGVCVEPSDGTLRVEHLAAVQSRAAEFFDAERGSALGLRDPRLRHLRRAANLRLLRAVALVEAVEASGSFAGLSFFASASAPIGGYEVHTCVGIPAEALKSLPAFEGAVIDRVYVGRSLQHEVIAECLRRADQAMFMPAPGAGLHALGAPTDDIVRAAAVRVIEGTVYRTTGMPADLFRAVNEFVSLDYERAPAFGRVLIARHEVLSEHANVVFRRPISLRQARIMRKLLELSDESTCVLTDGRAAYGLGGDVRAPDMLEVAVRGHATWELMAGHSSFVKVSYGRATLPRPLVDFSQFLDTAARTVGPIETDRIWSMIEAAQLAGHGTTLLVSSDPGGEAARLGVHAVPLEPVFLEPGEVVRLGRVDGAILLGPDGRCHALGVILDGTAVGRGDAARGSRFNSAVRYQSTMAPKSFLVVISDDGTVDLVPQLRPRVRRSQVDQAVELFCASCATEPMDDETFVRAHHRVKTVAFYLDEEQCRRVNDCYETQVRRRFEAAGISFSEAPLHPHPDMEDSYFLDSARSDAG
jgi:hypothetical protein